MPKDACFHVTLEAPDTYRFVIEDVMYPGNALGSGHVAILVDAVGIGYLKPRPVNLARNARLEFQATGEAGGAFEVRLFLVDSEGGESQPTLLSFPCKP